MCAVFVVTVDDLVGAAALALVVSLYALVLVLDLIGRAKRRK